MNQAGSESKEHQAGVSFVAVLAAATIPLPTCVHILAQIFGADGAPAQSLLTLVLALPWLLGMFAIPPWRRFASDMGLWLVARIGPGAWIAIALACAIWATSASFSSMGTGALVYVTPLTLLALRRARQAEPQRLRRVLIRTAVMLALLIGADLFVGAFVLSGRSHNSLFLVHDEVTGWKLRPDFEVDRVNEDYRAHETINSRGFRTPEIPYEKPPGTKRVVLLGDSHTEAYTVSDDETYRSWLEKLLGEQIAGPVQVVSLGVGGFSNDQELLTYLHHGRRYEPDLVVLQFCPNDPPFNVLDRYWRGGKPRFERFGDELLLTGVPVPDRRSTGLTNHLLLGRSSIAKILEGRLARIALRSDVRRTESEEMWVVTDLLIAELARWAEADGARFCVFNSNPDDEVADGRLRGLLEVRGIEFIDIEPGFGGDITACRVPEDHHWNPKGHEAVARLLAPRLLARLREEP